MVRSRQFSLLWAGVLGLMIWFVGCWVGFSAIAAPGSPSSVTEVSVSLGNPEGALHFFPETLSLKVGQRYKIVLTNPSPMKHYFTAKDFADAVWSQKVDAGNVEIKGAIHELELRPGAMAEWVVVPMRPGTYGLRCTIPGHTEAGMTGTIKISA